MRHKVYGKHLGRNKNQRTALFKSLVQSLILSEKIQTTESKAKAIKPLMDKLITQAKSKGNQKHVFEYIPQKKVAQKLMDDIVPRTGSRVSGYTSMVRIGPRLGDGAMMVSMSLLLEESKKVASGKSLESSEKKGKAKEEVSNQRLEASTKINSGDKKVEKKATKSTKKEKKG